LRSRVGWLPFGILAVAAALAACTTTAPVAKKMPAVSALPKPAIPPWIASISPVGPNVTSLSQIRVIFAKPVTKVEALSGAGPRDVLDHIRIDPALAGHFVVLTPRMVGFVADQALPIGARARVTLTAGLRDLDGDALDHDIAWTFETQPIAFTDLPQISPTSSDDPSPPPVGLSPVLKITANAPVDADSLAAHTTLGANDATIPVSVKLEAQPTPDPASDSAQIFDPSLNSWIYDVSPKTTLQTGTAYTLKIEPGVEPAYGNVATAQSFTGGVTTYGPLTITSTPYPTSTSGSGRFTNGDPAFVFSNPLDPKSLPGQVSISPGPANADSLVSVPDDSSAIAINPYELNPNSTYMVTIHSGVKDTFGQTFGHEQTFSMQTGNFTPGAWAPTGTTVMPAGAKIALNFYATNLPDNQYRMAFASVPPVAMLGNIDALSHLPDPKAWAAQTLANAQRNKQSVVAMPVQARLGGAFGALAYGFTTALDSPDSSPGLTGVVQLTNLGVFAQWFPGSGMVLVQHLSDGAPAPGVALTMYRISGDSSTLSTQSCATGTTDARGEFDLAGPSLESCYAGVSQNGGLKIGVVATEGGDNATVVTESYGGIGRFDVMGGWVGGAPLSRGIVFPDRDLYQPGETGKLTGVAYYATGETIVADKNATYTVKLTDPSDASNALGTVTTDAYGLFSMPIVFSKSQALGYYGITATGKNGNIISGNLRVAEFKPPNFKLGVVLSAPSTVAGGSIKATATGAYLFGAPLQGGKAHATVTRSQASLAPKGWDDFFFGPQWFWPENPPSFDSDVSQQDYTLDGQGVASFDVPVPAELPFPMTYSVDTEVSDVSNLSVSDSESFTALPTDAIVGLASDVVGPAASPMPIRVIVTDAAGKAIAGRAVHLDLQKMTYTSATQDVEGGSDAQQSIKYETVGGTDVTSANDPVIATLTPTVAGPYRVLANFSGSTGVATSTSIQIFAYGGNAADWGATDPNSTPVKLDKKTYKVGDTATALVAAPYPQSDIYFSVVRNGTLYRTILRNANGSPRIAFKITPQMLPNAAVEAVVVRRGANLAGVKPGSLTTLAAVGMAGFDVDVADRYLTIGIVPQKAQTVPGGPQSVSFALTKKDGSAARGEIVAMVVNDAILQLSGYRLPDLVATVFADQPISTVFSDNREGIVLQTQTPPSEKGFGYGGGYLGGAAGTRVRSNFLPLAYYSAVKTDASGHATVSFTMPDDLTTWRVMAVAVAGDDAHFGTNDATFVSTQPLITNPLLPQFARPGDTFGLGVSVANQTGAAGALDLVMKLTGALAFATGDPHAQSASEQAAIGMQAFRFQAVAGTPAPVTFQANSTLGSQHDAFSVPFTVSDRASTDSVIESGATAKQASIPIDLSRGGWLKIGLANSIVPQFAVLAGRSMTDDWLPLTDGAASRLIVASALAGLQTPYHLKLDFEPQPAAAEAIKTLMSLQRSDGGFGYWQGAKESDPFVSAYALEALSFAKAHGASVDAVAIANAAAFASQVLGNPGRYKWCDTDATKARVRFEMLWALAAYGDRRTDFLGTIVAQAGNLDSATQIRLARYLLATPGWQGQGATMADHLLQTAYVTGRYTVANVNTLWGWTGTLVDAQAQMLQLMLARHSPPEQLDGAVRALVAQQCNCGWPTLDTTASALEALSAYAATEHLGPASATVTSGGKTVASAQFGSTASSQSFTLSAAAAGAGPVVVTAGGGTVHYTLLYTYNVPNNAPGELSAFRVVRTVTNPGASTPLATMDIDPATPLSVGGSQVFDVGVRVIVDHPVSKLVIDDSIPAGFEAVDTSFRTSNQSVVAQSDSWDLDSQQIYKDKVLGFAGQLGPGVYEMHYLVRSVTPGTFAWPGAKAYLQDAPEQFGRSAATTLTVTP
jgi:alpha-2-macroglobulin